MSLKPLQTEFQGRDISIECTHKRKFPPPQMYGHSAEDVDKMWKQGAIDHTLHQSLIIWRDMCGLFLMDAKCLSCPQALLQKPRPGRPNVIETENFLEAKKRFRLEDARANRTLPEDREPPEQPEPSNNPPRAKPRIASGNPNLGLVGSKVQAEFEATKLAEAQEEFIEKLHKEASDDEAPKKGFVKTGASTPVTVVHDPTSKKDIADKMVEKGILESEPDSPPSEEPDKKPLADEAIEPPQEDDEGLDDETIAALADD